jgi:polygalacturonase
MKTLLFSFVCATLFSLTPLDGQTVYDIQTYGATGDGKTDDAQAIQKAINSCSEAGGGVVLIPAGQTFLTGPFDLKSNIELRVATGATLLANPDENVYTKSAFRDNQGEGTIWIGGDNVQNVTLTGSGTIDGNGISFMGKELDDSVKNIEFSNIRCTSENGIFVGGESAEKVTDIRFDQVDVDIGKRSGIEGGVYDRRPCNVEGIIKPGTSGFYLDQATRVGIINCSVRWGENKPDYFHYALETHGVVGLEVIQLSGGAAFPDKLKSTKED